MLDSASSSNFDRSLLCQGHVIYDIQRDGVESNELRDVIMQPNMTVDLDDGIIEIELDEDGFFAPRNDTVLEL